VWDWISSQWLLDCLAHSFAYDAGQLVMALHPNFPASPYAPLIPQERWFPADETMRATAYDKLLPPLVAKVRQEVFAWRNQGFVESIQSEGVTFEHVPMGSGSTRHESLIVEVDAENQDKNLDDLDIPLPKLTRRYQREFKNLEALDPAKFGNQLLPLKPFTPEETREIVFKTMLDAEVHHTIQLDGTGPADYRSVVAFFARQLLKDLRLVGGYDALYPKVRDFMRDFLFSQSPVNLEDPVVLRNLSESDVGKILYDAFKSSINALTVHETGTTRIEARIRLKETRPFRTDYRAHLAATKSIFNKVVGEPNSGGFELRFAAFLEEAADVQAFAKNYLAIGFKLDYVKSDGDLANYTPDFIVRTGDGRIWIVETKGRAELDLPHKMARLKQWCADATAAEENGQRYDFVFVDENGFQKHQPKTFAALTASFTEYKG
jgi:type III restriction enzyme